MSTHSEEHGGRRGDGAGPGNDAATDAGLGPVLTEAMSRLRPHEPGMPDLLGPAMVQGARIRRRRRANLLVAACAATTLAVGGALGAGAYLGGGDRSAGPAAPTARADAGRAEALRQALADALRPHMRPFAVSLGQKPWRVTRGDDGSTVVITVEDGRGDVATLTLSTGTAAAAPAPDATGSGCAVPAGLDRSGDIDYGGQGGVCEVWPHSGGGGVTWIVHAAATDTRAERLGAVRIGADRAVARAWTIGRPAGSYAPPGLVLDREMLAAIAADPAVAAAADRLPVSVPDEPAGPGASAWPAGTAPSVSASGAVDRVTTAGDARPTGSPSR